MRACTEKEADASRFGRVLSGRERGRPQNSGTGHRGREKRGRAACQCQLSQQTRGSTLRGSDISQRTQVHNADKLSSLNKSLRSADCGVRDTQRPTLFGRKASRKRNTVGVPYAACPHAYAGLYFHARDMVNMHSRHPHGPLKDCLSACLPACLLEDSLRAASIQLRIPS